MLLDQHSGSQHGPVWMCLCRARNHAGRAVCSLGTDVGGERPEKVTGGKRSSCCLRGHGWGLGLGLCLGIDCF